MRICENWFDINPSNIDVENVEYIPGDGVILPIIISSVDGLQKCLERRAPSYDFEAGFDDSAAEDEVGSVNSKDEIKMFYIFVIEESKTGIASVQYTSGWVEPLHAIGETDLADIYMSDNYT